MKIHITNYCSMGCRHCMEDSTVAEPHMTQEVFAKALALTERLEGLAWNLGVVPNILLSGGECTEHPEILSFIRQITDRRIGCTLISNGSWLHNPELRDAILRSEWVFVQVTHDPRFYPAPAPPRVDHPRIGYRDQLDHIIRLGRGKKVKTDLPEQNAPPSYNIRSLTRETRDITKALAVLRLRSAMVGMGACKPTITADGRLTAGETQNCYTIGSVDSTALEVTRNLLNMGSCNRCGLEDRLSQAQKRQIGISSLFVPREP